MRSGNDNINNDDTVPPAPPEGDIPPPPPVGDPNDERLVITELQQNTRQLAELIKSFNESKLPSQADLTEQQDKLNKLLATANSLSVNNRQEVGAVQQELSNIQIALHALNQPRQPGPRRGSSVEAGARDNDAKDLEDEKKHEPISRIPSPAQGGAEAEEAKDLSTHDDYYQEEKFPAIEIATMPWEILEAPDNSLGKILYEGLNSDDQAQKALAFQSLLNFAKSVDLNTQIDFFEKISNKLQVFMHGNLLLAKSLLEDLPEIKKQLAQDPQKIAANGKSIEDNYKALRNAIFAELDKEKLELPELDYESQSWASIILSLSKPALNTDTNKPHIGNIFNAVVTKVESNVTNMELRDIFEKQGITNARWFGGKEGGANNPGEEGGRYRHVYQDENGLLVFPIVFYKEPTETDKNNPEGPGIINYQEGIAEVMGGRMMNRLYGDVSAPLYATPILGDDGRPTGHVYAASVYHDQFLELSKLAYEYLSVKNNIAVLSRKEGKTSDIKNALKEILMGDNKYEHRFPGSMIIEDRAELRKSLGVAVMSSFFVGNYQAHTDNLGIAKVKDKDGKVTYKVVSLDYGGAMRPDYKTSLATGVKNLPNIELKNPFKIFTSPKAHGRFERSVRPLEAKGKKYKKAYLGKYIHEDIRLSKEFIDGIDIVANKSNQDIIDAVNAEVMTSIEKYGAGVFYDHLAYFLDRRKGATFFTMPPFNGRVLDPNNQDDRAAIQRIIYETTEFLRDTLLARRLSTKEFALELRVESAKEHIKDKTILKETMITLAKQNPFYALSNYKDFKVGEKLDVKFLLKQFASDRGAPVLEAMLNEVNLIKFSSTENLGIRRLATIAEMRLNVALDTILGLDFPEKENISKELTATKLQLNYALLSDDYKTDMDHNIILLMASEVFSHMQHLCKLLPEAALKEFIDKQLEITPKNTDAPADKTPRAIFTKAAANHYYSETSKSNIYNLSGGVEARPSPSPSASPSSSLTPSSASSSSSPSVSRLGMFTHRIQKTFTDLLSDFVVKIAHTFDKDKVARDALKQFVNSNMGVQELSNPNNVILQRVKEYITDDKLSNISLPKNILRTEVMNQGEFVRKYESAEKIATKPPAKISDLLSKTTSSLNDKPPPSENYYAMNFMQSALAPAATTTTGLASFLEERVNNVYSIKAVTLPPEVSRTFLLETHLPGATPLLIQNLREALRTIEIGAFRGATEAEHNTRLATEITGMLKNANVGDAQITEFLAGYQQNCRQMIAGNAIAANGYFEFVQAQILKFITEAGSNKTVRITPTNDPLLAQTYILICKANNIKFNNQSGFEFSESANNAKILEHVKNNFSVDASKTLAAVKELVHEIDKKLEQISAPVDNLGLTNALTHFKAEVNTFKTKVDKGEYISSKDLYKLIDNISVTTAANEEKLAPSRDSKRSSSF
jgi:hypothetical protein